MQRDAADEHFRFTLDTNNHGSEGSLETPMISD